jgi:hypothetical protein
VLPGGDGALAATVGLVVTTAVGPFATGDWLTASVAVALLISVPIGLPPAPVASAPVESPSSPGASSWDEQLPLESASASATVIVRSNPA